MNKTISDEQIIAVLLTSSTRVEAATILGISTETLYKRMKKDTFKIRYRKAKDALISDAIGYLQTSMKEAIDTVNDIMRDTENAPQVRINAADTILRYAIKLTETVEIVTRIEALEERTTYRTTYGKEI